MVSGFFSITHLTKCSKIYPYWAINVSIFDTLKFNSLNLFEQAKPEIKYLTHEYIKNSLNLLIKIYLLKLINISSIIFMNYIVKCI